MADHDQRVEQFNRLFAPAHEQAASARKYFSIADDASDNEVLIYVDEVHKLGIKAIEASDLPQDFFTKPHLAILFTGMMDYLVSKGRRANNAITPEDVKLIEMFIESEVDDEHYVRSRDAVKDFVHKEFSVRIKELMMDRGDSSALAFTRHQLGVTEATEVPFEVIVIDAYDFKQFGPSTPEALRLQENADLISQLKENLPLHAMFTSFEEDDIPAIVLSSYDARRILEDTGVERERMIAQLAHEFGHTQRSLRIGKHFGHVPDEIMVDDAAKDGPYGGGTYVGERNLLDAVGLLVQTDIRGEIALSSKNIEPADAFIVSMAAKLGLRQTFLLFATLATGYRGRSNTMPFEQLDEFHDKNPLTGFMESVIDDLAFRKGAKFANERVDAMVQTNFLDDPEAGFWMNDIQDSMLYPHPEVVRQKVEAGLARAWYGKENPAFRQARAMQALFEASQQDQQGAGLPSF